MILFIACGLASFVLSLLGVWIIRGWAKKRQWLVHPSTDRWHKKPTALYGGVGICLSFVSVSLAAFSFSNPLSNQKLFIALLLGSVGSCLLGLLDDILHYKALTKLIGQIALASLYIMAGGHFNVSNWYILNILLTYLWFIGIMNAVNLLDNMDGLAAGIVAIGGVSLLSLMFLSGGQPSDLFPLMIFVFIMSTLGFLVFNRYPASIFMGDTGSLFLGYTLAALTISVPILYKGSAIQQVSMISLIIPITILAVPIFDTTLVTITRTSSGRPVTQGGRDHSSHRLVGLGFSERTSVLILYVLAILGGVFAVLMSIYSTISIMIFGLYCLFLIVVGIYLAKRKVYTRDEATSRRTGWTPLVGGEIMHKKLRIEVVLDIILVALSYFLACLSFQGHNDNLYSQLYSHTTPVVVLATIIIFRLSGVYRGIWDLLAIEDIYIYVRSVIFAFLGMVFVNTFIFQLPINWPVYMIYGLVLFFLVIGSRLSYRFMDSLVGTFKLVSRKKKVLLYGAGIAGKLIVDEIRRNSLYDDIRPIGFIDDDLGKQGRIVSGIKILCDVNSLVKILSHKNGSQIREIWISSVHIHPENIDQLMRTISDSIVVRQMKLAMEPL